MKNPRKKLIVGMAAAAAVVAGGTAAFAAPQAANQGVVVICAHGDPNNASGADSINGVFVVNSASTNPCTRDTTPVRAQGLNTGGPVNGYQRVVVTGPSEDLGPNGISSNVTASCSGGRSLTGGGANIDGDSRAAIRESYPLAGGDTWTTHYTSAGNDTTATRIIAYALCVNATN